MKKGMSRARARNLRASALIGASVTGLAAAASLTPALAQTVNNAGQFDKGSAVSVETVVVTAEKRPQVLKDVPASVSVIGGGVVTSLGIQGTPSLLQQVPGASLVTSGPGFVGEISMRGQGAGRNGFSETSTGLYENGSYMAGGGFNGRQLTELNLFDVDRIEILRGPQGALYGRNAVGGAVNVIVNQPTDQFSAQEQVSYGSPEAYGAQGIINGPINLGSLQIDTRLGAFYNEQDSGFVYNQTTGHYIDTHKAYGARAGFLVHPTSSSKLYAQFEYYDDKEPSFGTLGYVPVYGATTSSFTKGETLDPGPYARDELDREGITDAPDVTEYVGYDQTTPIGDLSLKFYNRNRNASRTNDDYDHYVSFPGFSPIGVGGVSIPIDMGQSQFEAFHLYDTQATFTSNGAGPWKWLVGAEFLYYTDRIVQGFDNCATYDPTPKTSAEMAAYEINGSGGCVPGLAPSAGSYSSPALLAADRAVQNALRGLLDYIGYRNQITSYAGFATLSYDITPKLTFGIEGRVTHDKNDYSYEQYSQDSLAYFGTGAVPAGFAAPLAGEFCSPAIVAAGQCTGAAALPYQTGTESASWTEFLPAATLRYKVTPDQTVYVRAATGYRPGGFNNPLEAVQPAYKPEYTESVETGWKGLLLGVVQGDVDIYYQKTRDVQLVQYSTAVSGGFVLQNVGDDYVYGVESDLTREFAHVGPGALRLTASLSSDNGKFSNGTAITEKPPDGPISIAGLRVPFTTDIEGSLDAQYVVGLPSDYHLKFEINDQFASAGPWNYSAASGVLNRAKNQSRNELDLHLTLGGRHNWSVSVFGKNVLDYRYRVATIGANPWSPEYWSEPATWGIILTARQ